MSLRSLRMSRDFQDIFYQLQQKRSKLWSLRDCQSSSNLVSRSDDYDSDSTAELMDEKPTVCHDFRERKEPERKRRDYLPIDNYISSNLDLERVSGKVDGTGDDSDTATDILLAQDITSHGVSSGRRNSMGSNGSASPLNDEAEPTAHLLHRRSKSVDAHRDTSRSLQNSTITRSGSITRSLTSKDSMLGASGHRKALPSPLPIQHINGDLVKKGGPSHFNSTLTNGLRPFAPRNAGDIRPEDVVKFSRVGGKLTLGTVKYIGPLPGRGEVYLGVQLDKDEGKHDGTFEGTRYYRCKPNKGVFVAFNKVVMAWAP